MSDELQKVNSRCYSRDCINQPSRRVFWPGKEPAEMCEACTQKALAVGRAIGCYIHTEPLQREV